MDNEWLKAGILGLFMLTGCDVPKARNAEYEEALVTARIERLVKARLKDPESAMFKHYAGGCGYVNSRNSLGGMSGDRPFIVGSNNKVVFYEDGPADFDTIWNSYCANAPS